MVSDFKMTLEQLVFPKDMLTKNSDLKKKKKQ